MIKMMEQLVSWYQRSKRNLPWRNTVNPYFIWVSEIILQQTRVDQGLPYYLKFIETFPSVESLANANQQDILNIWKGLGYYRRALNMHQAAWQILNEHKGEFPLKYKDLLKLKGVGEYTAAAIASIAYGEKKPVVDGNVIRVMSRVFLLKGDKNNHKFKRQIADMIMPSMNFFNPSEFNQALMELGALVCSPQKPSCYICPIKEFCKAYITNNIEQYPQIIEKNKQKELFFNYIIITDYKCVLMHLRTDNNIWKNMYEFPLIEANKNLSYEELIINEYFKSYFSKPISFIKESKIYKHILSHRIIYAKYFVFTFKNLNNMGFETIAIKELDKLPMPRLIEKMKSEIFNS